MTETRSEMGQRGERVAAVERGGEEEMMTCTILYQTIKSCAWHGCDGVEIWDCETYDSPAQKSPSNICPQHSYSLWPCSTFSPN